MTAAQRRIFVLDTNVLMHDPTALFRFQEHDVYLPMVVLEELDASKKGLSEVSRNVRQVSRFLDQLISGLDHGRIEQGIALDGRAPGDESRVTGPQGRLFFETRPPQAQLPAMLPGNKADNSILVSALSLRAELADCSVTLVSKDINLRIKAAVIGIDAEDYINDQVLEDLDLLATGTRALPADFWASHGEHMESWQEQDRTFYRVHGPLVAQWYPNQFLHFERAGEIATVVRECTPESAVLELVRDYGEGKQAVWACMPATGSRTSR